MAYTDEQLKTAFDKVKDKKDWKSPINTIIEKAEDQTLIQQAIIHYTGTVCEFIKINKGQNKGKVLVKADGYRNGPCGDH